MEDANIVAPAYEAYMKKASELQSEFGNILMKYSKLAFGCDEKCVSDCLNYEFINFYEIPDCVKSCPCESEMIKIERGSGDL
jgi:hypothetical protein